MWQYYLKWHALYGHQAAIAHLGERQTEDLKVPGSIPGLGMLYSRLSWLDINTKHHFSCTAQIVIFWESPSWKECLVSPLDLQCGKASWFDSATFPFANPMLQTPIVNAELIYRHFNFWQTWTEKQLGTGQTCLEIHVACGGPLLRGLYTQIGRASVCRNATDSTKRFWFFRLFDKATLSGMRAMEFKPR